MARENFQETQSYMAQEPWLYRQSPLPHYYGDTVRQLLIAATAVMLVGAPFYTSNLPTQLPIVILTALILVCFAAFTSPRTPMILIADMIVSGVGMALFEIWALQDYESNTLIQIVLRQAIALVFLFAFYFAGKTYRGFVRENELDEEEAGTQTIASETPAEEDDLHYDDTDNDGTPDALEESYEYKEK